MRAFLRGSVLPVLFLSTIAASQNLDTATVVSTPVADTASASAAPPAVSDSESTASSGIPTAASDSAMARQGTDSASVALPTPIAPDTTHAETLRGLRRMETTVVRGKLRGRNLARKDRKDADNRKDVVSAESIQEHPDPDVADALQRVPGVTLQRDQGEGRYVQIRGSEPRFSNVTIDGQKVTTSSGDTRAVALDVIPVDQLSQMEVVKVLMPEMDGDAIGGTVNLVTSTAQDTQWNLKALAAGGWNELADEPLWQGSAALSRRFFKDGALGVYLGGSWFRSRTRTDAMRIEWDTIEGNRNVVWNLDQRQYLKRKEREGLNGRLDWRFPEGSMAFLTGSWNRTDESETRYRFSIQREGAQQISEATPDSFRTGDDLKYQREVRWQEEIRTVSQATLGGSTRIGPVAVDLAATGSFSDMDQKPSLRAQFSQIGGMNSLIDPSDPDVPVISSFYYPKPHTADTSWTQASNYKLENIISVTKSASEDDLHGRLDARMSPGEDSVWLLKFGGKVGWNRKTQEAHGSKYGLVNGTRVTLDQLLSSYAGDGFYDGHYTLGPLPDLDAIRSWVAANASKLDTTSSSDEHIQYDPQCYKSVQDHAAIYGQARWRDGDLSVVGGLRAERFVVTSTGNVVSVQSDESWSGTAQAVRERTFDFFLPMVSGRWNISPQLVGRASYTRSFALPDAMDLLPTDQLDLTDLTDKVGNPDLKATLADAAELDLEWYRKPRGMASVGVFAKRIEDYVFPRVWEEWDNIRKVPITYFSKQNGDIAWLQGVELELQQPLSFLPWLFSGLGVECNYTWTHSVTTLPGRSEESTLPGQSDHSGNLGLRYDLKGFTAVLSGNFQSPFLYQIGTSKDKDTWVDCHFRLDASVAQRLGGGLLVYAQVANITNAPYRLYTGDTDHPSQIEYTGRVWETGLRLSL